MPPFPEKEVGGLLNLLKRKRPGRHPDVPELKSAGGGGDESTTSKAAVTLDHHNNGTSGSADLLGLGFGESSAPAVAASAATNGVNGFDSPKNNISKYVSV